MTLSFLCFSFFFQLRVNGKRLGFPLILLSSFQRFQYAVSEAINKDKENAVKKCDKNESYLNDKMEKVECIFALFCSF